MSKLLLLASTPENWNWGQIALYLFMAILGGVIARGLDFLINKINKCSNVREQKVKKLEEYITDYGEVAELYRFFARFKLYVPENSKGELKKDKSGKFIQKRELFEPEKRFVKALKSSENVDFRELINRKIIKLRLQSAEINDIALQFDKSGKLKQQFEDLYFETVQKFENLLNLDKGENPLTIYESMIKTLDKAGKLRNELRKKIAKLSR